MKLWKVAVVLAAVAMFTVPANAGDPPGDTCATAVAPGTPVDVNTDTMPTGPLGSCSGSGGINDKWISFVATETTHRLRTDLSSAGTDSEFLVFASDDNTCDGTLTQIACSSDDCFNGANFCAAEFCEGFRQSPWLGNQCVGGLVPGDTYFVQMGTFNDFPSDTYTLDVQLPGNTCGDGLLACDGTEECETDDQCPDGGVCNGCVCEAPCPSTCAGAIDIGPFSNCGAGGAAGATLVDPCCDPKADQTGPLGSCTGGGDLKDVWLSFVADAAGVRVRTDVGSVGTDSNFIVYSGDCGDLVEIGCSEDSGGDAGYNGDINIVGLTIGDTFLVQLGGWAGSCGPWAVTVEAIVGSVCGDGIRAPIVGEVCDPGDGAGGPADDVNCEGLCGTGDASGPCECPTPECGNGIREIGEQCDLGADNGESGCLPAECDCTADCKISTDIVPAVSEWGLVVMVLIGLAAGTVMFGRKRVVTA